MGSHLGAYHLLHFRCHSTDWTVTPLPHSFHLSVTQVLLADLPRILPTDPNAFRQLSQTNFPRLIGPQNSAPQIVGKSSCHQRFVVEILASTRVPAISSLGYIYLGTALVVGSDLSLIASGFQKNNSMHWFRFGHAVSAGIGGSPIHPSL